MTRSTPKFRDSDFRSVDEKLKDSQPATAQEPIVQEPAVTEKNELSPVERRYIEKQQAMKKFGLVAPTKRSPIEIDEDLHSRFKIAAIRMKKTQKEWLSEILEKAINEAERKLEKII